MPYNRGMSQITLALPSALPPAPLAPDLIRTLQAPALATLLSRQNNPQVTSFDSEQRVWPHEAWLASALGLDTAQAAPFAIAAMRGSGLAAEASQGRWFMVQPAHVQLARTHMLLTDPRQLRLSEEDARALFDSARLCFEEIGATLLYARPDLWFARADAWTALDTASPDAAIDQNLSDWLPQGESARSCRKLQNEIQMQWHEHPANQTREQRGQRVVNSVWIWGGAVADAVSAPARAGSPNAPLPLATSGAAVWLEALSAPALRSAKAPQLLGQAGAAQVLLDELIAPAVAGDWADWLARLQRIEEEWCAPLLAALKEGRIGGVTLLLNNRNTTLRADITRMAQYKFWRKPSLNALLDHA